MNNTDIKKELEEKVPRSISGVQMIDGKISASFCGSDPLENEMWGYWNYEKIFNTWNEFSKYAQDFFKLT